MVGIRYIHFRKWALRNWFQWKFPVFGWELIFGILFMYVRDSIKKLGYSVHFRQARGSTGASFARTHHLLTFEGGEMCFDALRSLFCSGSASISVSFFRWVLIKFYHFGFVSKMVLRIEGHFRSVFHQTSSGAVPKMHFQARGFTQKITDRIAPTNPKEIAWK